MWILLQWIWECKWFFTCYFHFLQIYNQSGITEMWYVIFRFPRNALTVHYSDCIYLHFHQQCVFLFLHIFDQYVFDILIVCGCPLFWLLPLLYRNFLFWYNLIGVALLWLCLLWRSYPRSHCFQKCLKIFSLKAGGKQEGKERFPPHWMTPQITRTAMSGPNQSQDSRTQSESL